MGQSETSTQSRSNVRIKKNLASVVYSLYSRSDPLTLFKVSSRPERHATNGFRKGLAAL